MRDYAYRPRVMIIAIGYARRMRIRSRFLAKVDITFRLIQGSLCRLKALTFVFIW